MKQGKVWGNTEEMFNNGTVSINLLRIVRGGFCSEHQHTQKTNIFYVVSGSLEILQWPGDSEGEKPDVTVLRAGQQAAVPVGVWHRFRAIEDTVCLEVYEVGFTGPDIRRRTHGGVKR